MNQVTTYPPSPPTSTTTVPPSTPTALTGSSEVGWMVPVILALVVIGAVALRIATTRARRLRA